MTSRRGGRPSTLDAIYRTDPETGATITVEQEILRRMATGAHADACAAAVGFDRTSFLRIIKIGGDARLALEKGTKARHGDPDRTGLPTFTPHEDRVLQFCDALRDAELAFAADLEVTLTQAGRRHTRTITTIKTDAAGNTIETSTRTEEVEPDMATVRWRAERHRATRKEYRPPATELTGPEGGAIEVDVTADKLIDLVRTLRTQQETEPDD